MPAFLIPLVSAWFAWSIAKRAAVVAVFVFLALELVGLHDQITATIQGFITQLQPEIYSILCIAGAFDAMDLLLMAVLYAIYFIGLKALLVAKR